jgi:hypothetical protein
MTAATLRAALYQPTPISWSTYPMKMTRSFVRSFVRLLIIPDVAGALSAPNDLNLLLTLFTKKWSLEKVDPELEDILQVKSIN